MATDPGPWVRTHARVGASVLAIGVLTGASAASIAAQRAPSLTEVPDIAAALASTGIDERALVNSLATTLQTGRMSFHFPTDAMRADENARLTLIRTLAPVLPATLESAAFASVYGFVRRDAQTALAGAPPPDPSMTRADSIHELSLAVIDVRRALSRPGLPDAERRTLQTRLDAAVAALRTAQEAANDPATVAADQEAHAAAQAEYETRRAAAEATLEATLPRDPRQLAADRLDEFIATCRDVNFRARTATEGGVTRFVAAADEARPPLWKMCFRAGQRTTQEARRAAQTWLTRLGRAGIRPHARR